MSRRPTTSSATPSATPPTRAEPHPGRLAEVIGVNRRVIGELERGKGSVRLEIALAAARAVGLDVELRARVAMSEELIAHLADRACRPPDPQGQRQPAVPLRRRLRGTAAVLRDAGAGGGASARRLPRRSSAGCCRRVMVARRSPASSACLPGNDYGLLAEVGGDCAGAITLLPPEATMDAAPSMRPLDDEQLDAILRALPTATARCRPRQRACGSRSPARSRSCRS